MKNVYNLYDFGAVGDGMTDDSQALHDAIEVSLKRTLGCVLIPPGDYYCPRLPKDYSVNEFTSLSFMGYGSNVSRLFLESGLNLRLSQNGIHQAEGLTISDIGIHAANPDSGTALTISYGNPTISNEHYVVGPRIRGVSIVSGEGDAWGNGILLEGVWNPTLDDVFISGSSAGGNWNNMRGIGVELRGMCVNAHLSNVRTNFWATGLLAHGIRNNKNTEGIFCSNCDMVGVQRGVWLAGDASITGAPRIHTLNWTGGMIENRVGGVTGGSAAFHLQDVWGVSIVGCTMLTETWDCPTTSYAVIAQDCRRVAVSSCDITAYHEGIYTTGACKAMSVIGNTFAAIKNGRPVAFNDGCVGCVEGFNTVE